MINDFLPISYRFYTDIKIYPISDLHIGAAECLEREWAAFRSQIADEPDSYITIGGDMMNNALKSSKSNSYEDTMRPREQKRWLVDQLKPIKDKILCVVPGNHELRSSKDADDDPMYDVCCKLDIEDRYRENAAFLVLRFGGKQKYKHRNPTYTMCVMHGSGGGVMTGSAVNKNERFAYAIDGLDMLVTGHTHKPVISTPQKLVIDPQNNKVSFKPFKVITATSWLEYGGYALQKQMLPATHCLQEIWLSSSDKKVRVLT